MDRASWVRIIERWFQKRSAEEGLVYGYPIPGDVPVLQGPVDKTDNGAKPRFIQIYFTPYELNLHGHKEDILMHARLEYVVGYAIIPDTEVCVVLGEGSAAFVPWSRIVYIRG